LRWRTAMAACRRDSPTWGVRAGVRFPQPSLSCDVPNRPRARSPRDRAFPLFASQWLCLPDGSVLLAGLGLPDGLGSLLGWSAARQVDVVVGHRRTGMAGLPVAATWTPAAHRTVGLAVAPLSGRRRAGQGDGARSGGPGASAGAGTRALGGRPGGQSGRRVGKAWTLGSRGVVWWQPGAPAGCEVEHRETAVRREPDRCHACGGGSGDGTPFLSGVAGRVRGGPAGRVAGWEREGCGRDQAINTRCGQTAAAPPPEGAPISSMDGGQRNQRKSPATPSHGPSIDDKRLDVSYQVGL